MQFDKRTIPRLRQQVISLSLFVFSCLRRWHKAGHRCGSKLALQRDQEVLKISIVLFYLNGTSLLKIKVYANRDHRLEVKIKKNSNFIYSSYISHCVSANEFLLLSFTPVNIVLVAQKKTAVSPSVLVNPFPLPLRSLCAVILTCIIAYKVLILFLLKKM